MRLTGCLSVSYQECSGLTVILGPNGAGKTTLLKALMGLIPRRGMVLLVGVHLLIPWVIRSLITAVTEQPLDSDTMAHVTRLTILTAVALVAKGGLQFLRSSRCGERECVPRVIDLFKGAQPQSIQGVGEP